MSNMNKVNVPSAGERSKTTKSASVPKWSSFDRGWTLGLYGTAIGAGVMFLPIDAGLGGLMPLVILTILAWPMAYLSHRGLFHFVLEGREVKDDITFVVDEYFGQKIGTFLTFLYFIAICPLVLTFAIALTNTLLSFIANQLHFSPPARPIMAIACVIVLMSLIRFCEKFVVKVMSCLVFPLITVLLSIGFFLIPNWSTAIFHQAFSYSGWHQLKTLWITLPVVVFTFNFSPIISSFTLAQKEKYGPQAERAGNRTLYTGVTIMWISVMFLVWSCALSLSPQDFAEAKAQNLPILPYLANHFNVPSLMYIGPTIATVALTNSFLGHYMGAREGFNGLLRRIWGNKAPNQRTLNKICGVFFFILCSVIAWINPGILNIVEVVEGPIIAMLLFLMPMIAIHRIPALACYRGKTSNVFVTISGLIAVSAMIYIVFL